MKNARVRYPRYVEMVSACERAEIEQPADPGDCNYCTGNPVCGKEPKEKFFWHDHYLTGSGYFHRIPVSGFRYPPRNVSNAFIYDCSQRTDKNTAAISQPAARDTPVH